MGPQSKTEICNAIGYLIEESAQQRETLRRIEALLRRKTETESADLTRVNQRITEFEKALRGLGVAPAR